MKKEDPIGDFQFIPLWLIGCLGGDDEMYRRETAH
jgi:hypothetical protein